VSLLDLIGTFRTRFYDDTFMLTRARP
jgi:hypothetical protein